MKLSLTAAQRLVFFTFGLGSLNLISPVHGQEPGAGARVTKPEVEREVLWDRALTSAKNFAVAGKIEPAENALTELNFTKPGTADWYAQTAAQLTRLIYAIALDGNEAAQRAVAVRAIENLQMAERLTRDSAVLSQVHQQVGRLQERVLHDVPAAKEAYRRAAADDPRNATARGAVDRLEKLDRAAAAKTAVKG